MTREEHHAIDLKLFHRFDPDGVREGFAQLGHEGVDVLIASEGATERERLWSPSRIDGDALRLCQRVAKEYDLVFELQTFDGGWRARFKRPGACAAFSTKVACARGDYSFTSTCPALACSCALCDLPTRSGAPWV